ncbi:ferrochelatase [bacterium]|nr:ferrochelatase [bacterium]
MSKAVFNTGIIFAVFVFLSGGVLFAGEFGDKIDKADDCYQQGRHIDAVDNLKDAVKIAWEAAALSARNINFVKDGNSGFQKFVIREDRPFAGGENIIIYLEPVGFSVEEKEGGYFAHLETDYELLDSESRELAKEQEFGDFEIEDTTFFTDISLNLNFSFTGLIDGNYTLKITIRDVLSGEEYILTKDFKFAQNPDE